MTELRRYGMFLIRDPQTCSAVTRITGQLRARYGVVAPHLIRPVVVGRRWAHLRS